MSQNTEKSQGSVANKMLWLVLTAFFAAGLYANYCYFKEASVYFRIVGWIFGFIVIVGMASFTSQGQSAKGFLKSARSELRKVVWPSRQETIQTTMLVIAMVVVVGFVLWGVDSVFMILVGHITG